MISKEIGQLLLVTWSVLIAFLLVTLSAMLARWSQRKRIASFMRKELSVIKENAEAAIDREMELVSIKTNSKKDLGVQSFEYIDDADFPTLAFQSVSKDIVVLDKSVSASIQDVYNRVEYAHHWKKKSDEYNLEFKNLMKMHAAGRLQPIGKDYMDIVEKQVSRSVKKYWLCVHEVAASCDTALGMLKG